MRMRMLPTRMLQQNHADATDAHAHAADAHAHAADADPDAAATAATKSSSPDATIMRMPAYKQKNAGEKKMFLFPLVL